METEEAKLTVVVRTPDQSSDDFVIECNELWTVKKIKSYICKFYPTKPAEKNQKIIYSGKLLADNSVLKDVFREQDDQRHTVHLVCLKTAESVKSIPTLPATSTLPQSRPVPSSSVGDASGSQTDGLRHRPPTANSSYSPYNYPYNYGGYQMQYGANNIPTSTYYQAYWMQQYYAQQMAQYAQYSNQQMTSTPNALNANVNPAPVVNLAAAQPVVPNVNIANNAPPAQNNVRMNAGVGPAIDDDDDDQMNRDWLDWSYMFFRATVLISIVYFYSSMNRFMIVIGFISFFYFYRQRQQTLRRQVAAGEAAAAAAAAAAPPPQEEEIPTEQTDGDQHENEEHTNQQTEQPENESQTDSNAIETPPSPPQPGVFATAWIFFSSFFTSLIPHEPPPANLN
ncbi:homocysteine-responsive endoplasmic reticulum-resident ubiquitin-like domain member 2 protein [Antedon mediterranea]|uniref:homocysteine-responsive endoplasmic reticulum-resident ubiquitin-like domain member 2 protein n=1 Tax=Antedon mediterranea TaxID=105859 RepID=UPI003AF5550E